MMTDKEFKELEEKYNQEKERRSAIMLKKNDLFALEKTIDEFMCIGTINSFNPRLVYDSNLVQNNCFYNKDKRYEIPVTINFFIDTLQRLHADLQRQIEEIEKVGD